MNRKEFLKRFTFGLAATAVLGPDLVSQTKALDKAIPKSLPKTDFVNYDGHTMKDIIKAIKNVGLIA